MIITESCRLTGHPSSVLGYHAVLQVDSATDWMINFRDAGRTAVTNSDNRTINVTKISEKVTDKL